MTQFLESFKNFVDQNYSDNVSILLTCNNENICPLEIVLSFENKYLNEFLENNKVIVIEGFVELDGQTCVIPSKMTF
jgi:hypothetical protein